MPGFATNAPNGATGAELFTVTDQANQISTTASVATGDIDHDGRPEIIASDSSGVRLIAFEHDGTFKWRSPNLEFVYWGAPALADLDQDGTPEIILGRQVLNANGTIKWAAATQDSKSNRTGSSVFDFDGDGSAEVVYRDELYLRVYRGLDGAALFQVPMSSCTWHEYVLVADVDADGNAEIVSVANNSCGFGPQRGFNHAEPRARTLAGCDPAAPVPAANPRPDPGGRG